MSAPTNTYSYHVFLSHNRADKAWTRRLASALRSAGLLVFFDEDSISLGEDVPAAIEEALGQSRHILLVLSPRALESKWLALEISASIYRDPRASQRSIIPIIRKDCKIPLLLARLNHLDARGRNFDAYLRQLLASIDKQAVSQTSLIQLEQSRGSDHSRRFVIGMPVSPSRGFYVMRAADYQIRRHIEQGDTIAICLFGPRRIGKTSMLLHAAEYAERLGKRTCRFDMQAHVGSEMDSMLSALVFALATATDQKPLRFYRRNQDVKLVKHQLLDAFLQNKHDAVLLLDEVDYLRHGGYMIEFFSLLRAAMIGLVANKGAGSLTLITASYLNPSTFIDDELRSPFNIGPYFRIGPFDKAQTEIFFAEAGFVLPESVIERVFRFSGGQPIMLQHIAGQMAAGANLDEALHVSQFIDYVYGLDATVRSIAKGRDVLIALESGSKPDWRAACELVEVGILRRTESGELDYAAEIYRHYLNRSLLSADAWE